MGVFNYGSYSAVHTGKPGLVFGTGMSMSLLFDQGPLTVQDLGTGVGIAVKQAHRKVGTHYWVSMDEAQYHRDRHHIRQLNSIRFTLDFPEAVVDAQLDADLVILDRSRLFDNSDSTSRFVHACAASDSGVAALRFASLMGLNPLYLVGLGDRVHDGRFYFHTDSAVGNAGPNTSFERKNPRLTSYVEELLQHNLKIISCSPISTLNELVPFMSLNEALRILK